MFLARSPYWWTPATMVSLGEEEYSHVCGNTEPSWIGHLLLAESLLLVLGSAWISAPVSLEWSVKKNVSPGSLLSVGLPIYILLAGSFGLTWCFWWDSTLIEGKNESTWAASVLLDWRLWNVGFTPPSSVGWKHHKMPFECVVLVFLGSLTRLPCLPPFKVFLCFYTALFPGFIVSLVGRIMEKCIYII